MNIAPSQAEMKHAEAFWDVKSEVGRLQIADAIAHPNSERLASSEWLQIDVQDRNMILEWMHNNPVGYFNTNKPEPLHIKL